MFDGLQRGYRGAVDSNRNPLSETNHHILRRKALGGIIGVLPHAIARRVPRVFQKTGLNRTPPHVLIHRVRVLFALLDGQPVLFGIRDCFVSGEGQVANGRNARELGGQGCHRGFESNLVITLTRAPVGHRISAKLPGDPRQVLGNEGAGERRNQGIALLVEGISAQCRHHKVVSELILGVNHQGLYCATIECALANIFHVLAALAYINGECNNFFAGGVFQPANSYRRVETTGIR